MDPNACVTRIADALRAEDWGEARHAIEDLQGWLERGGFQPDWEAPDAVYFRDHAWKVGTVRSEEYVLRDNIHALRIANGGILPARTTTGAYPIVYLSSEGEDLCPECANDPLEDPAHWSIHYEGTAWCAGCGAELAPAYEDD